MAKLAFGCAITNVDVYRLAAERGIAHYRQQGHYVFAMQASGTVARTYNTILREARRVRDVDALVLVHQDLELLEFPLIDLVGEVFADPGVAVVGGVGTSNDETVAWWEGDLIVSAEGWWQYGVSEDERLNFAEIAGLLASRGDWSSAASDVELVHEAFVRDLGRGERPEDSRYDRGNAGAVLGQGPPAPSQALYGCVLILNRWAIDTLSFDERFRYKYGWDIDFCRQARSYERECVVAGLAFRHHHTLALVDDHRPLVASHIRFSEKWGAQESSGQPERATRLEAEAALARLAVRSAEMYKEALERELLREREALFATRSWRATGPLRWGKSIVRRAAGRLIAGRHQSRQSALG